MSYMPGARTPAMKRAAVTAPAAKTSRERAGVLYLEHLVEAGEHDLMLADDGAASDGGDAYLMLPARLAHAVALEGELRLVGQGLCRGLRYHQRGAAGGVHLAAVVALDDLDVEIRAQDGRRRRTR